MVAYDASHKKLTTFANAVKAVIKPSSFFHGIYIIKKNWFIARMAGEEEPTYYENADIDLAEFLLILLDGLNGMDVGHCPARMEVRHCALENYISFARLYSGNDD